MASFKASATLLEENGSNFSAWIVTARALLRREKLWIYASTPSGKGKGKGPAEGSSEDPADDAFLKHQEAADLLVCMLSEGVKKKFTEAEFNDGYLLIKRARTLFSSTSEATFMRASTELYSLRFNKSVDELVTKIKTLSEEVDNCKVELTSDKRTLLVLSKALTGSKFSYLTSIWLATPDLTAERAINMVKEEERRVGSNTQESQTVFARNQKTCTKCGRTNTNHTAETCWKDIKCDNCKQLGHPTDRCREEKQEPQPQPQKNKGKPSSADRTGIFTLRPNLVDDWPAPDPSDDWLTPADRAGI